MHNSLEIVTPAACMDLTVLETVKSELGIAPADTSQDDRLSMLIKQSSGIIASYCNTVFGAEEVIETFWSDSPFSHERSFMLSREPVSEIISVVVDGLTLDPSAYRMARDGHLHRLDSIGRSLWCLNSTAVIHYIAGYVLLDDLPYGVERAALSLIKDYHFATAQDPKLRSEDIPGLRSVSYQIGNSSSSEDLPPEVVALLTPYRRLAFA